MTNWAESQRRRLAAQMAQLGDPDALAEMAQWARVDAERRRAAKAEARVPSDTPAPTPAVAPAKPAIQAAPDKQTKTAKNRGGRPPDERNKVAGRILRDHYSGTYKLGGARRPLPETAWSEYYDGASPNTVRAAYDKVEAFLVEVGEIPQKPVSEESG